MKQINPGLARLWLADNTRQYGAHGQAKLENLSEEQHRLLDYLESGVSDNQLALLSGMALANQSTTDNLLSRLRPLISTTSSFLPDFSEADVSRHFSEIMRLFLLDAKDPAETLKSRGVMKIFVSSLDRTGLTVIRALAASAIGSVFTEDHQTVGPGDTLQLGYPPQLLKIQRAKAAKSLEPGIEIQLHSRRSNAFDRADIAILISNDVVRPGIYQPWMSRDVPHISVCYDEVGVEVSHLVIPGVTPCLGCIELAKIRHDKHRISVATQLANLDRDLADSSSILFGAGVLLTKSLNYLDRMDISHSVELTRLNRDGEVIELEADWTNCGCRTGGQSPKLGGQVGD